MMMAHVLSLGGKYLINLGDGIRPEAVLLVLKHYAPRSCGFWKCWWKIPFNFIKRKNGDKTLMVRALCSRLMDGEPCAACQFVNEAKLAGVTFPQSDDPSAKMEIVYNVIVRGREHLGPLLLKCGPTLHGLIQDKVRRYPRVYDPRTSGCDIIINRKGTDRDTKYLVEMDLETVQSIGSPDFVKGQHDLRPEMRNELTMSEIRAKLDELGLLSAANVRPPPAAPARRLVGATPQYPVQAPTQAAASRPAQAQPTRVDTRPAPKRSAQDMAEDDFE